MKIHMDYDCILRDRVIIVTGAGRSGTTILGKLIGSMEPAFYFFEPTLIKFGFRSSVDYIQAAFVEDYVLPTIQGRNINTNRKDDSWIGHYELPGAHVIRQVDLPRRDDALAYIELSQMASGGFESWGSTNSATDSWGIASIAAGGEDPTSVNWTSNEGYTPVDDLLSFQNEDGSFNWQSGTPSNKSLMTAYATAALLGKPYPVAILESTPEEGETVNVRVEGQDQTIWSGTVTVSDSTIIDDQDGEQNSQIVDVEQAGFLSCGSIHFQPLLKISFSIRLGVFLLRSNGL